jgi:hypothetical protein
MYVFHGELNENVHPHTSESGMRVSTNAGQTFGPVVMLGSNGTIVLLPVLLIPLLIILLLQLQS